MKRPNFKTMAACLLLVCGMPCPVSGQSVPGSYDIAARSQSFCPASRQASELFCKKPEAMDYSTGRATIRIPVYTIRTASFTLPISLSYTTGGIKAEQKNGPVALGWTLEAEPVISREVRGLPDEQSFLYDKSNLTRLPDIYKARIGQGTCDVLEDIFHMKLIDASADFVLQQADSHQFIPRLFHRPELKVSLGESETKVNDSFNNQLRVIDGTGNKYLFGQDANAREETSLVNSYSAQTAWKASEITSPDGGRISFSYYTDLPDEVYKGAYDYYATEDNYPDYHVPSPGTPPHPGYWAGVNGQENYYYMNGTTIQPGGTPKPVFEKWGGVGNRSYFGAVATVKVRPIKGIAFSGGTVSFSYSSTGNCLEKILVKDTQGNVVRSVTLMQKKAGHGRILLEALKIADGDGNTVETYKMNYFGGDYDPATKAVDYWGYYNGKSGNTDFVPRQTVSITNNRQTYSFTIGGADKSGDLYSARIHTLSDITYPAGGKTVYAYGLSRIPAPDSASGYIDGGQLRITEITDYPVAGHPVKRVFKYYSGDNEEGIGSTRFPMCNLAYRQKMKKYYVNSNQIAPDVRPVDYTLYTHSNSVTQDQDVYFDKVMEFVNPQGSQPAPGSVPELSAERQVGESTVHHFDNRAVWPDSYYTNPDNLHNIDEPVNNRVLLQAEKRTDIINHDRQAGSVSSLPRHSFHDISDLRRLSLIEGATDAMVASSSKLRELYQNSYSHRTGKGYTVVDAEDGSQTVTVYGNDTVLTRSVSKIHENRYNLIRESKMDNSDGTYDRVVYTYPFDRSNTIDAAMTASNELSTPVEARYYSDGNLLKTVRYRYEQGAVNRGYSLSAVEESVNAANTQFRDVETYSRPLKCGRPCQVTSRDGTITTYLWGYGGKDIIAVAHNLSLSVFETAGIQPETLAASHDIGQPVYDIIEQVRKDNPQAQITAYRYRPLVGVIQETAPNGMSTYYEYDSLGRLTTIKDTNKTNLSTIEYHEVNP